MSPMAKVRVTDPGVAKAVREVRYKVYAQLSSSKTPAVWLEALLGVDEIEQVSVAPTFTSVGSATAARRRRSPTPGKYRWRRWRSTARRRRTPPRNRADPTSTGA